MKYVLIPKFCAMTGISGDEVARRITSGTWRLGREYVVAPDNNAFVNVEEALAEPVIEPPPTCGVYLLKVEDAVVYVGRSTSLAIRLATHRRSGRPFDEAQVIPCDEVTADWLERELIRTLAPPQNLLRYARHSTVKARELESAGLA